MRTRIFGERADVFGRRVTRDFTARTDDISRSRVTMTRPDRLRDRLDAAVAQDSRWIHVTQRDLPVPHFPARLRKRVQGIQVHNVASELVHAFENVPRVAANMQAHLRAEGVGQNDLAAGLDVSARDLGHALGVRQIPQIRKSTNGQSAGLQFRTPSAVGDYGSALDESLKQSLHSALAVSIG